MLVETVAARQSVIVTSDEASAAGVRPGMALVQARAICPGVIDALHEPQQDARSLEALARWLMRFSPTAAVEPPDAIFVDVTGTDRLFHGMSRLAALAFDALAAMRVRAVVTIAPTPGAAWALAYAGRDRVVVEDNDVLRALAPLPVESLRIGPEMASALRHLGIDTCGVLLRFPRETLPARFGKTLLTRLDQALGRTPEPLVPLLHHRPIGARLAFDGEVESFEVLHAAVSELLSEQVVPELARRGLGARRVEIELHRSYARPIGKNVLLVRPSRDTARLLKLVRSAIETLASDEPFVGVRVSVPIAERLSHEQATLIEEDERVREVELDHFIDRLHARFGEGVIVQPRPVESHVPERAYEVVPPGSVRTRGSARMPARNDRPLHLFACPVEVRAIVAPSIERDGPPASFMLDGSVHRVVYAIGPERIEGRWWDGHGKTRDYFEVEDAQAARFWIFRVLQTGKWYVHGMF